MIVVVAALAFIASSAAAQSGRRIPKKPPNREPVPPSPKEDLEENAPSTSAVPATPVIVASDLYDIAYGSSVLTGVVTEGIMDRLGEVRSIRASAMGDRVNRKDASDAAKKSTDTYVLWFQLRIDSPMGTEQGVNASQYAQYLYVDYVIFAPGTGKQKTMGHVYQRQRGVAGGVPFPGPAPRTTAWGAEYALRYAGRETADRLLDILGLARPPNIPH
jgi:hypothetical protein